MSINNINGFSNNFYNYQTRTNPNAYAQQYATQNGISIDDAKNQLRAQYGEPDAKGVNFNTGAFSSKNNVDSFTSNIKENNIDTSKGLKKEEQELLNKGISLEVIFQGDSAIRNYAQDNNITLDDKKVSNDTGFTSALKKFAKHIKNFLSDSTKPEKQTSTDNTTSVNPFNTSSYKENSELKLDDKEEIELSNNPFEFNPQQQTLMEAGVPYDVILEGDDAIMKYIQGNNITNYTPKTNNFFMGNYTI